MITGSRLQGFVLSPGKPPAIKTIGEILAGTPLELIMKISGHKSLKDFYKYIRITPE